MALDLKLITSDASGNISGCTWPNPDFVDSEYNLIQRVVKNLLTSPGSDQWDPTWGSGLRDAIQGIPGQDVSSATQAVAAVLQKCTSDVITTIVSTDPAEQLIDLRLASLSYDAINAAWNASVIVITQANQNNPTVVSVSA